MKHLLLACMLTLAVQPLLAETFRWVNEDGVVTYSQTPPPGGEAERIKLRNTTAPSGSESSKSRLNQLRQRMADSAEDRELKKQKRQESKEEMARLEHNCKAARSNLSNLEGLGNRLYKTGGEYRRLSEEERQELMQKARENIEANCGK